MFSFTPYPKYSTLRLAFLTDPFSLDNPSSKTVRPSSNFLIKQPTVMTLIKNVTQLEAKKLWFNFNENNIDMQT